MTNTDLTWAELQLLEEEMNSMIKWVQTEGNFPTGIRMFDAAWQHIRRERFRIPAINCPTSRQLIRHYMQELKGKQSEQSD